MGFLRGCDGPHIKFSAAAQNSFSAAEIDVMENWGKIGEAR